MGTEGLTSPSASSYLCALRAPEELERLWNEPSGWEVVFVVGLQEECTTHSEHAAFSALQRARLAGLPALVLAPFPQGAKGLEAPECAPWRVWVGCLEHRVRVDKASTHWERSVAQGAGLRMPSWAMHPSERALERALQQALEEVRGRSPVLRETFEKLVAHEHEGDCYLANLTATLLLGRGPEALPSPVLPSPSLHLERVLARGVRFGAHALSSSGHGVLLSSPERFLRVVGNQYVFAEPIKGTSLCSVPAKPEECNALWSSCKETAELVLVTDLLRNDLNLVCKPGSVHVHSPFFLRTAGGLLQMQSTVFGELREETCFVENILSATLPAGSVSGTPKKRVRELLSELETTARGAYTGILGLLDSKGNFDSAVCIRSVFSDARGLSVGVGVGVTSLSNPAAESEEIRWKLGAVADFWTGTP